MFSNINVDELFCKDMELLKDCETIGEFLSEAKHTRFIDDRFISSLIDLNRSLTIEDMIEDSVWYLSDGVITQYIFEVFDKCFLITLEANEEVIASDDINSDTKIKVKWSKY